MPGTAFKVLRSSHPPQPFEISHCNSLDGRTIHLLREYTHLFLPPPSHTSAPVGFLQLVASSGPWESCTLAQRTQGKWAVTHTGTSICCAARAERLSFTQAWMRQTSTQCPQNRTSYTVSSSSHYLYLGWGGGLGETSTPTTWFKNSSNFQLSSKTILISNFQNLFIPTDGVGIKSHKIHFLALPFARPAWRSYNSL